MSELNYDLRKAFIGYVTMIEHFRNVDSYRAGATALRNGLPKLQRGEKGFRDVRIVKQFVELVMVEEDELLELICESDAASTIEALSPDAGIVIMTNPAEIKSKIFMTK